MSSPDPENSENKLLNFENRVPLMYTQNNDAENSSESLQKTKIWPQVLAVLVVSLGNFISSTTISYTAVSIPRLTSPKEDDLVLSDDDISLFVSVPSFGMLVGSLLAGPIINLMGRKLGCIFGTCGSLSISYALVSGAPNVIVLIIGRFLSGVGLGLANTIPTVYIIEITTPNMRGVLAVVPAIFGGLGVLFCQILGAFITSWRDLSVIMGFLNVPFLFFLFFIPESPTYFVVKNNFNKARRSFRTLRGQNWDITKELTDLQKSLGTNDSSSLTFNSIKNLFLGGKATLHPFALSLILMFFFQFSGISIIMAYTVSIFVEAGSSDEFFATIYVGLALLVSNVITLMLVGRMNRRIMISLSALGISITLTLMGAYFYAKEIQSDIAKNFGWFPVLDLMVYILFFNLGFGALIWVTAAEILPSKVRSVANGISVGFTCLCSFLITFTFTSLKQSIGIQTVFWIYGGVSFLGFLFILKFLPETKGKTVEEIEGYFKRGGNSNCQS